MKNLLLVFCLVLPLFLHGQDQPAYALWRNVYLKADNSKIATMEKNLAAHNKAYHSGGPFHAVVWRVTSGKNFGKLLFSMGPHTWGDVDARNAGEAHGQDWTNNVLAHCESMKDGGTWEYVPSISYVPDGISFEKVRLRFINVKRGENYRFNQIMKKLAEAYQQGKPNQAHAVFDRHGATDDGREYVVFFGYNNWAEMADSIVDEYEAVHGEGSWNHFQEEVEEVIASSEDELIVAVPTLSGDPN